MKQVCIATIGILCGILSYGQSTRKFRILFIGNSYTYVNELPKMTASVAASVGDTLEYDSNTPGGQTLRGHLNSTASTGKIAQGGWDYVVLQEQSQMPAFADWQVEAQMYPYAHALDSLIRRSGTCTETVFYMTWGRKNGDTDNCGGWPVVCTYEGMDSLLRKRYMYMADENEAIVSPVGAVWRYLRQNNPGINLYSADNSHPDVPGTYAAAVTFYTVLFRKDPTAITFNAGLNATTASDIRQAVKLVVYNKLGDWFVGRYDATAAFTHQVSGPQVTFQNQSTEADSYRWLFGDGTEAQGALPQHTYPAPGTYTVKLIARRCGWNDTATKTVQIVTMGIENADAPTAFTVWPNPADDHLRIGTSLADPGPYNIRITDITGKTVLSGRYSFFEAQRLDISQLQKGVYLIQVLRDKETVFTKKWIKR